MTSPHPIIEALHSLLGKRGVLTGDDMGLHLVDVRGLFFGGALVVARPSSTNEVANVVRLCAEHRVAVVPQGGNTGMSGGAALGPEVPHVLVSLSRMNKIERIHPDQWTMTVQAGATIAAMHETAGGAGRLFGPDWGARGTATIGGAIATDAGGNNVLRYGNMRDQVLGIEAVLPDGRVWNGMRALRKDSSGYDLKQLFVGAEGTLGIVTRAIVKLHPATPHQQSALAALTDLDGLMALYALALEQAPGLVTAFELIPNVGIQRITEVYRTTRPTDVQSEFYALIKLASTQPVTDTLTSLLAQAVEKDLIVDAVVAGTADQEEQLWFIRDELSPTQIYRDTQSSGLKLDTAVPLDLIGEYHERVNKIATELVPKALCYGFGHVGDGNLHMMVLPLTIEEIPAFSEQKPELIRRIDAMTVKLGGTLSAEHGVGRDLRDRIRRQKSTIEWELMHTIKAALDPNNMMNPGALLPDL